jgi:hypothetical protein
MKEPLFGFEWNQVDEVPPEFEEGIFTLVARDSELSYQAIGTGFVVKAMSSAAIALSAGHVFAEIQRLQRGRGLRSHSSTPAFFAPLPRPIDVSLAGLLVVSKSGRRVITSAVEGLVFDETTDLGVMQLKPQAPDEHDYALREFTLEDVLPQVGQLVCVGSYRNLKCKNDPSGMFAIERRAVIRVGKVLAVYPEGHRLCRGPCFETTIPVFSGMSGGPAFFYDEKGPMRAIGLVCSDPDVDGPIKDDRSVAGRSLIASLPVRRLSGVVSGKQEVLISLAAQSTAGIFDRDATR